MKRKKVILGIAIGVVIGILVVSFVFAMLPVPLDVEVRPFTQRSYVPADGRMDVDGARLAWQSYSLLGSKLTVVDGSGEETVVYGVSAPFQLLGDQVVYIEGGSLKIGSLDGKSEWKVADDVSDFIATPELILYQIGMDLYQCDPYGHDSRSIKDDTYHFFVTDSRVYSMDIDGHISCLGEDGTWTEVLWIRVDGYPFSFEIQGDRIVYMDSNEMCFVDLDSGEMKKIPLVDETYSNHRICYVCDEEDTFISFQGTKTDGSIVTDIDHGSNGLWVIDPETWTLRKLSDDVFQELYLFGGDQLFGVIDRSLYQIDTRTGERTQVAGLDLQHEIGQALYPGIS
ncbi:MAG: hypothetical protein IJW45_01020 [Oscillospiraceae bacterium]|nr:hypothetical protein [Oscillospiraceae bacterium]